MILPDKYLSLFPFELIKTEGRFLTQRFAVSYANSASILRMQQEQTGGVWKNNFAGFAPTYDNTIDTNTIEQYTALVRSGNWQLPHAQQEVQYIAKLLQGQALTSADATKEQFFENLKNSKIVHLSPKKLC